MSMGAEKFEGSIPQGGYGIYLRRIPESQQKSYVLFADSSTNGNPPNHKCDHGSEEIEEIFFESDEIKIKDLPGNHLNIIFKPPDPTIFFTDGDGNILDLSEVSVEISLIDDEAKNKTITVNKAGLITIE